LVPAVLGHHAFASVLCGGIVRHVAKKTPKELGELEEQLLEVKGDDGGGVVLTSIVGL